MRSICPLASIGLHAAIHGTGTVSTTSIMHARTMPPWREPSAPVVRGNDTVSSTVRRECRVAFWLCRRMVYRARCYGPTRRSATCLATPQPTSIRRQTSYAPTTPLLPGPVACRRSGTARPRRMTAWAPPPSLPRRWLPMARSTWRPMTTRSSSTARSALVDADTRHSPHGRVHLRADPGGQDLFVRGGAKNGAPIASVIATGSTTIPTITAGAHIWIGKARRSVRHAIARHWWRLARRLEHEPR